MSPPDLTEQAPFVVHPLGLAESAGGILLSFSVGVADPTRASLLDIHHLFLRDQGGLGMVAYLSTEHSALYHWPRRDRGEPSLARFLSGCSLGYVAGKFRLDDDFDADATEERVRQAVEGEFPDRAADIMHDYSASTLQEFRDWVATCAPSTPRKPAYERFSEVTRINLFFASFWNQAKFWMRTHLAELDGHLYPAGGAS